MNHECDAHANVRRLTAACVLVLAYSLAVLGGLFIRWQARAWGLVFSVQELDALVTSAAGHCAATALSLGVILWARRRPSVSPFAPKFFLASMPILLLMSVDSVLRVACPPPAVHPRIYVPHATRDWTFRPNSVGTHLGKPLRINSHGLPGPEVPYEKGENEYRIMFLGDSVVAGFGVREEESFVRLLAAEWRREMPARWITAVNCSVTSYSPWQEVDLLRAEGMRYDPDVIVHIFCLNDYVEKFHLVRFGGVSTGPYEFVSPVLAQSGIYRAVRAMTRKDPNIARRQLELADRYSVTRLINEPDAPQFDAAWRITFENMRRIVGTARERKRPIAIVCFPYAVQIHPGALDQPAPQVRLAALAQDLDVPLLDLLPVFRGYARERHISAEDLFLDTCHPTPEGHALAARAIQAFLVDQGFLP